MANLSDVESAMKGDTIFDENIIVDIDNNYNHVENDFVIFKLKSNQKRGVYIDGTDDVINPKTGKTERVRLLTGVSTIWKNLQFKFRRKK